jgi:hypothetical protein
MKKLLQIPVLVLTFGVAIIASSVQAASPAQDLLLVQMRLSPGTNASSIPTPPRPKIGAAAQPGTRACVPSPPLPKRVPVASPAATVSKC